MEKILSKKFDITGNETLRVGRTYVLSRFVPLGNFSSGPNLRCLLVLGILHHFAGLAFWFQVRNEQRANTIYNLMKRIVNKII